MNEYLDYNINSGWFIDEYNAFKTQSELIFLPFTPNWGCKPAHGSVGGTAMTKSVRKYLYWVDYYMCTNFQRVLMCFWGLGEPRKVQIHWGSGHNDACHWSAGGEVLHSGAPVVSGRSVVQEAAMLERCE